jgi:4-amino-4-deoxy-L-arabinose transferase-like glycosyltransferase
MDKHGSSALPRKLSLLRRGLPAVYVLLAMLAFALLDVFAFGLTDQDEGFYASVARGMLNSGNYLTPYFDGKPWFLKPPLLYWLMSGSMSLFGVSAAAARLPSVLGYALTSIMLLVWGNRRLGKGAGTYAALAFALSPLVLMLGRLAITDMLLVCCLTAALIGMWETTRHPAWCILWGVAAGLATLTKGLLGIGLIGAQALITLPILLRQGLRMRWAMAALALAMVTLLPWYVGVYIQHGNDFFVRFIVKENLLRFGGGDSAHASRQPLIYLLFYVGVVWLGLFPFSALLPRIVGKAQDPVQAYVRRWCLLTFCLFTLAVTKLPAYILPLFPGLALLIGHSLTETDRKPIPAWITGMLLVVGAIFWISAAAALAVAARNPLPALLGVGLSALGLLAVKSAGNKNRRHAALPLSAAIGIVVTLVGLHFALRNYDAVFLKPIRTLALSAPSGAPLVVYKFPLSCPSLRFYRSGNVMDTESLSEARRTLGSGGYCLTTKTRLPLSDWQIVRRVKSQDRTYTLLTGKTRNR